MRTPNLRVIGIKDDEKNGGNAGKESDVERDLATQEIVRGVERMRRDDQSAVITDRLNGSIVRNVAEIGLDHAAEAPKCCGLGQKRSKAAADIGGRGSFRATENDTGLVDEQREGTMRLRIGREIG
ncbi:hypothetical protein D3C73_804050 [compost metagenome]